MIEDWFRRKILYVEFEFKSILFFSQFLQSENLHQGILIDYPFQSLPGALLKYIYNIVLFTILCCHYIKSFMIVFSLFKSILRDMMSSFCAVINPHNPGQQVLTSVIELARYKSAVWNNSSLIKNSIQEERLLYSFKCFVSGSGSGSAAVHVPNTGTALDTRPGLSLTTPDTHLDIVSGRPTARFPDTYYAPDIS